MGFRATLLRPYAKSIARAIDRWSADAISRQEQVLKDLLHQAATTAFGRDHRFSEIPDYEAFKQAVPIRDYEDLKG
ncbi:MAG: GH3 auxin-responsive promoter family protein, partial [Saprospiraceae bacterium]|nr:GH3 auxin-responsive promoter family protein [Saprospiraceae bacterium]